MTTDNSNLLTYVPLVNDRTVGEEWQGGPQDFWQTKGDRSCPSHYYILDPHPLQDFQNSRRPWIISWWPQNFKVKVRLSWKKIDNNNIARVLSSGVQNCCVIFYWFDFEQFRSKIQTYLFLKKRHKLEKKVWKQRFENWSCARISSPADGLSKFVRVSIFDREVPERS